MRRQLSILVTTLALNVALWGALIVKPELAPLAARRFLPARTPTASTDAKPVTRDPASAAGNSRSHPAQPSTLWASLATDDLRLLVERLRAAGFPPHLVRAILEAKLEKIFSARMAEVFAALNGGSIELSYWKPDPTNSPQMQKYWDQQNQLYRERQKQLRALMGDDLMVSYGLPANFQSRTFGNLSKEKLELIQRINDDYSEMTNQVRAGLQGITLPEDTAKLALLEREKRADIAALLSPEELAEYEMRTSRVTQRLQATLTVLDSDETEFRAIYRAIQPLADQLYPVLSGPENADQRREAQKLAAEAVKAALGEQRFADYARASTQEFQQLSRLAQRENVPADAAVRAFSLRDTVSRESNRIFDDATLSNEAKRAALQALAQTTRAQFSSILGPTVGPAYAQTTQWLTNVETGRAVNFQEATGTATFRRVPGAATPPPRP